VDSMRRIVFVAMLAIPVDGQVVVSVPVGQPWPMLDASNQPMMGGTNLLSRESTSGQRAMERGAVSVAELEHPLKGKGLALLRKAEVLLQKREISKALELLRQAVLYPEAAPHALAMLGTEHLKRGDFQAAVVELRQAALGLCGNAAIYSNLALALALRNESDAAIIAARRAVQLDPANAKTRFVLARILLHKGEHADEAAFHLHKAAESIPAALELWTELFAK
jgi:Flp pilus assembly protein TadD